MPRIHKVHPYSRLFACLLAQVMLHQGHAELAIEAGSQGTIRIKAASNAAGNLILQRSEDLHDSYWREIDARAVEASSSIQFELPASTNDRSYFRTMLNGPRPSLVRYVDPNLGSDANDGLVPRSSFRSIKRALQDIPPTLAASYEIRLTEGTYLGPVEIVRAGSASDLSAEEVLRVPLESLPVVRIVGPTNGNALIKGDLSTDATLRFLNVSVSLRDLQVEPASIHAITVSGGTLIAENLRITTASKVSGSAIHCHRSCLYLGGTNSITGPFSAGISLRTYALARPGTRDFPQSMILDINGASQAIFLRDFSTFTSTFNSGLLRIRNVEYAVLGILGSNVFLTGGAGEVTLDVDNVRTVFRMTHRSEANVHNLQLKGLKDHFCIAGLMSIVSVEAGSAPRNLVITNFDSSSLLRVPTEWGAITPNR